MVEGEVEGLETRGQARAFLMEVYGVVERLGNGIETEEQGLRHVQVLQSAVHMLHGTLSFNTGELPNCENELKVRQTMLNTYNSTYNQS